MEVIGLQIFVSLMLVLGSVLLFAFSAKQRDHEHGDRLALLPLENDFNPAGQARLESPVVRAHGALPHDPRPMNEARATEAKRAEVQEK